MFSDISKELGFTLSEKVYAYGSLDEDDVENIIEGCKVRGFSVDGYVDDGYFSTYISRLRIRC